MKSRPLWFKFLKYLGYCRHSLASLGGIVPNRKTMRGERDDIVSLEGRDGFHGNNEENKY